MNAAPNNHAPDPFDQAYLDTLPTGPMTVGQYATPMETDPRGYENRWEFIDGHVRRINRGGPGFPSPDASPRHEYVCEGLVDLRPRFADTGSFLRGRADVVLDGRNQPVPDASVVHGSPLDYLRAHPTAADVLCVVEVADDSEASDLCDKLRLYARSDIPMYVVLRLRGRSAVVLTGPSGDGYANRRELSADDVLSLPTAAEGVTVDVPLSDLLPPAEAADATA